MRFALLLAGLTAGSSAFAAACPSFDVDLGSSVGASIAAGSNAGFGNDVGGSCAAGAASEEVTFLWTAPSTATYTITTDGSNYDTALTIQDFSTCTEIACDDDTGEGLRSLISLAATAGTSYAINVDGFGAGSTGNFLLSITETCTDSDGDGVCDSSDVCFGNDFSGDADFDGLCDDLDFTLSTTELVPGQPFELYAFNAPANTTVYFLAGGTPGATCAPGGSPCVGISRARLIGTAVADSAGFAFLGITAPAVLPPTAYFQAASAAAGDVTQLISVNP